MRKITIITGSQGAGKSTKALELALETGQKFSFIDGQNIFEALKYMNPDTELLIFDDSLDLAEISKAVSLDYAILRKPYKKELEKVVVPDLIITTHLKGIFFFEGVKQYQIINL
jgi:cytidylate kinase